MLLFLSDWLDDILPVLEAATIFYDLVFLISYYWTTPAYVFEDTDEVLAPIVICYYYYCFEGATFFDDLEDEAFPTDDYFGFERLLTIAI